MDKVDCRLGRVLIDASLDGELDLVTQLALDEHLAGCADCAAFLRARGQVVQRLRSDAQRFAASPQLRQRIIAALPEEAVPAAGPSHRPSRLTKVAWASSFAALAASLVLFLGNPTQPDEMTRDLVAAHVRSLIPDHLIDIPSSDRHTVKPWFNGRVTLSPPVPDLAKDGFVLVGGRLDYVDDHRAAVVVYRRNQHVINLFVWPESGGGIASTRIAARNGYNLVEWTQDGLHYSAVSDVALADLEMFQRLWSQAASEAGGKGTESPPP